MKNNEFKELILNAQQGDQAAMTKILEVFQPLIYKYSLENGALNEDCYQELNIKLIKCIKAFKYDNKDYEKIKE